MDASRSSPSQTRRHHHQALPVYPPEAVYPVEPPTNDPAIGRPREKGTARLAYLAGDVDASYWRLDNWDLGRQLTNTIAWVLQDGSPVTVAGEGLMEVAAWQTEPGFAVHIVNYNGPNAYRGRMRLPSPSARSKSAFTLPHDAKIKSASLLRAEKPLKIQANAAAPSNSPSPRSEYMK